jgi:hypothetical protein
MKGDLRERRQYMSGDGALCQMRIVARPAARTSIRIMLLLAAIASSPGSTAQAGERIITEQTIRTTRYKGVAGNGW